jgi:purine-binding chemotaxis protein CheW
MAAENMANEIPKEERAQYVIFRLGESEFGVEIGQVLRIVRLMKVTRVPRSPGFLEGVVNIRGEMGGLVPIVDLKKRFELPWQEYSDKARILVVEVEDQTVGMIVDSVLEIAWLPTSSIKPPPEMVAEISGVYLTGLARLDDRLIIILNLNRVLTTEEIEELEQIEAGP